MVPVQLCGASRSAGKSAALPATTLGATMMLKFDIAPRPMKSLARTSVTRTRPARCAGDGLAPGLRADAALRGVGRGARLSSICTGPFVLAQAGLLDGGRATTHWRYARERAERFPEVALQQQRIERARELLESTDLPMTEVARRCGIGTVDSLRQHVARRTGLTPSACRATFTRAP